MPECGKGSLLTFRTSCVIAILSAFFNDTAIHKQNMNVRPQDSALDVDTWNTSPSTRRAAGSFQHEAHNALLYQPYCRDMQKEAVIADEAASRTIDASSSGI